MDERGCSSRCGVLTLFLPPILTTQLSPCDLLYQVHIHLAEDPITCAWQGQRLLATDPASQGRWLTRAAYQQQRAALLRAQTPLEADLEGSLEHVWDTDDEADGLGGVYSYA